MIIHRGYIGKGCNVWVPIYDIDSVIIHRELDENRLVFTGNRSFKYRSLADKYYAISIEGENWHD